VQTAAETFRANPKLDTAAVLTELAVGEALVSCLDEKGQPTVVERAFICPPSSQIGPIRPEQRKALIESSILFGTYEKVVDRESAFEKLRGSVAQTSGGSAAAPASAASEGGGIGGLLSSLFGGGGSNSPLPSGSRRGGRPPENLATTMMKSTVRTIGSSVGREIVRGVLGSIFGGRRR
jgi:DNA helicase HerA-like ATPase